jgi:hypothetical protein
MAGRLRRVCHSSGDARRILSIGCRIWARCTHRGLKDAAIERSPLDSKTHKNYPRKNCLIGQCEDAKMLDKIVTRGPRQKREKFVELAERRTRNAIKAIRVIAKLGNRSAYDFSESDVKKIAAALAKEVEALKVRMLSTGGKESVDFKL